jgi:copper transport protein
MLLTSRRHLAFVVLALCAITVAAFALPAGTSSAHNALVSSDPADGASLTVVPTQVTWMFDRSVPLETLTVTLIDATGARTQLPGSTHGPTGDAEVVTPLPALQSGDVSLRWRLVGPDGHPVSGRIDFAVAASTTTAPGVAATPPPETIAPAVEAASADEGDGSYATPSSVRWILRYASYLAIMATVGILLTSAYVWSGAADHPLLRRVLSWSLFATAALAFGQLLVIASDVGGNAPWTSFGSIDAATVTDAGVALMVRIVLALALWVVLFQYRLTHADVYWSAVTLPGLALLATWAFAGHSRSMRWPEIGVLTDVAHHAAAAAWIGGLAIVGWIVIPKMATDVLVPAVRRFSRVAAISVAILVATGLVQTVRLVGNPAGLLDADHGRYLAVKVLVLAAMLAIANVNRQRVNRRLDDTTALGTHVGTLRRAVLAEFAIGLVIIAITAAMVVSPPSTSVSDPGATPAAPDSIYYTL